MDSSEQNLSKEMTPVAGVAPEDLAQTLCHYLSLDQQVLLRLFRRHESGELNQTEFMALLSSFCLELPRRKRMMVATIVREMESGKPFIDAIEALNTRRRGRLIKFNMISQSLQSARKHKILPDFLRAVSNYRPTRQPLAFQYQDTLRKKLTRLAVKTLVIFNLIVFIMCFIVPEFQKMYWEFGVELPQIMQGCMIWCDRFVKLWFVVGLPLIFYLLYKVFTFGSWGSRVTYRFSPWSWLQRPLPKRGQRKLALALSNMGGSSDPKTASTLLKRESAALNVAESAHVKSWLLRRSAINFSSRKANRKNRWGDALIMFWNIFLAFVVAVFAISIISCLITIVEGLV